MSFSIFTRFKAIDGVTPAFNSMVKKSNVVTSSFGRMARAAKTMGAGFKGFMGKIFNLRNAIMGSMLFIGMQQAYQSIKNFVQKTVEAAKNQTMATTKLYTILKNVHSIQARGPEAYKQAEDYLTNMATKLQRIGVIGDEISIAGFQQLATFQMSDKEIGILAGSMNDLLAQQKGLNATQQDAVNIANLMGKVMDGQVGALRRVGVSFSKAEEKVLKTGTRLERATMLAKVLQNNVGGVNQAIAQAPEGKIKNMTNLWGDMYENIGIKILPVLAEFAGLLAPHIPEIQAFILFIIGGVLAFLKAIQRIGNAFKPLTDSIRGDFAEIKGWFNEFSSTIGPMFSDFFKENFPTIISIFKNLWTICKALIPIFLEIFTVVIKYGLRAFSGLLTALNGIINFVVGVFSGKWKQAFKGLADFVVGIFKGVWELIKGIWEIVNMPNQKNIDNIVNKANKKKSGDKSEKVPGFASGTNYYPGGLAWVGERGPELVDFPSGTKIYNNKSINMFEKFSKSSYSEKVINIEKILERRKRMELPVEERKEDVVILEVDFKAPEGYEAKIVNAKSTGKRKFKARLRGKTKQ